MVNVNNPEQQLLRPGVESARFAGHVVVVTGAAGGIGGACALRFAQEQAAVACLDVDAAGNEGIAAHCRSLGGDAVALPCDVTQADPVRAAVAAVLARWGRIDTLVASAGVYTGTPLIDLPLEQWRRTLEVNLTGALLCNQAVAPILMERRAGSIVNISSMAGKHSWPASAEYSASKSGLIGLTRSVAMELAPYGATANAVCPGNTLTGMVRHVAGIVGGRDGLAPDEWLAQRAADCPMRRIAQPWEMAGVVAFLASEDARYLTGQAIEVDGGMIMS
jgi:NAD(P)-dependent dehydrogenase (short-subunit alcohol dehydrogenase family)